MVGAVILIVLGALVVVTGVLGAIGRLPRNRLAGVRTSATMRSNEAFAIGNRVAAPAIILGGVAAMAGGAVALFVSSSAANICELIAVLVMAALAILGGVRGSRAAGR
jgi:uncharacterized membrane protein